MVSSEEDPRSKRGGHLLFDHSFFPDLTILRVRNKNFTISASYLALHSPYFYDLFYGPNSTELNGRYVLDFDPDVFGDLLDFIYPCYKKTNCCADCSSSRANRLDLALQLELRLAVKRLIKDVMASSVEDPRSKRGGHLLFDHSSFPDTVILRVRDQNFTVSASYLALHSHFFYNLFYGPKTAGLKKKYKLDCDPDVFGELLDIIYPSYKKTNCCFDCYSSINGRLDLALQFELRFAVKRLLKDRYPHGEIVDILYKHNAITSYRYLFGNEIIEINKNMKVKRATSHSLDPLPVSAKFPDSTTVFMRGKSMLVSATALSLHSSILCDFLYKSADRVNGVQIDVNPNSFLTFIHTITGDLPTEYTFKFLDDLLFLGARHLYEYFMSETRMKLVVLPSEPASQCAMQLLEHYCNQPNLDLESALIVACYLSSDQLKNVLSKSVFLSPCVEQQLRNRVNSAVEITIFGKALTGKTLTFTCPRGLYTSVLELKMKYMETDGVPIDQQRWIFAGMIFHLF